MGLLFGGLLALPFLVPELAKRFAGFAKDRFGALKAHVSARKDLYRSRVCLVLMGLVYPFALAFFALRTALEDIPSSSRAFAHDWRHGL